MQDLDVSWLEAANASIDALLQSRAGAAAREEMWCEAERRYDEEQERERRQEWAEFYHLQIRAAESMRERAVERLARLIDGER